jgi:hypothetical protein
MAPTSYAEVVTRNIRAARSRQGLAPANVVARMRALGYETWHRQTMGKVERGERRVTAEEVFALSLALETTIAALMEPKEEDKVIDLPSGGALAVEVVRFSAAGKILHGAVQWDGDQPMFSAAVYLPDTVDEIVRVADELQQHHDARKHTES